MDKNILQHLQLPSNIVFESNEEDIFHGRFIMKPLEKGYAITIGNSLRRVLLSSLHGYAISSIRIEYQEKGEKRNFVKSEFDNIPNMVLEDTLTIISNLKKVRFTLNTESHKKTYNVEISGPSEINAKILENSDMNIVNPEEYLFTITKEGKIFLEYTVEWGKGFVAAEKKVDLLDKIGIIPIDSIFSPVKKVNFQIEAARVENITDYESLILDVWTDGTIKPKQALEQASYILIQYFSKFITSIKDEKEIFDIESVSDESINDKDAKLLQILDQSLDVLEFTERIKNCFNSANIKTFRDLLSKTDSEIENLKNFGKKSLETVIEKLRERGLSLNMKDEIERIEKLYKKNSD
ncbi:MAG TPA: DNA-directed RNA polymerase subunit alpha [Exilispira sp.]|nr:DNA-directed RNA polymerase subunit alpha [Exilispira sp.]